MLGKHKNTNGVIACGSMKEKELYIDFEPQQSVYYVEKDDESYGPVVSGSQLAKNYLDDFFEKRTNQEKTLREQLKKGEISPVYYYLIMQEFGEGDLASRAGVSLKKLRKHYRMDNFIKLRLNQLKKYAEAFDIPIVKMFSLFLTKQENSGKFAVEYAETNNPYFVVAKIESVKG
jgi:hypothetical protein